VERRQYITHVDEQAGIRKTDEIAVGCALLADGAYLDDVSLCLMYMFSMVASTIFFSFHSGGSKDGLGDTPLRIREVVALLEPN